MGQREPLKVWIDSLRDEGPRTAVYPYVQLREILAPNDCRQAVLDQTEALEVEFGRPILQPLYDLLWTLNGNVGVFTSHTVSAPRSHRPPYDWATDYVAIAIICLSRNERDHLSQDACIEMVNELGRVISRYAPEEDTSGWRISVGPCNMIFTPEMSLTTFRSLLPGDTKGYGCQLIVGGAAGKRHRAASRCSRALAFVNTAISRAVQNNAIPATPHRHLLPGTGAECP